MVKIALSRAKKGVNLHGGATAIGGYVYQILASTRHQITAESFNGGDPYSDAIIYVHEAYDQDAAQVSKLTNSVKLIQVKYSSDGTHKKIAPTEANDIANTLLKAAKLATGEGLKVTGYELLSNRGWSPTSVKKVASCQAANKKTKFKPGSPTKNGILGELKELTWAESQVRGELETFGKSYGLKATEIEDGIDRLTGKIFAGVARNKTHAMSKGDLLDIFLDNRQAKELTRSSMDKRFETELLKFNGGSERKHIPRERTRRLLEENPFRALFVFLGEGGMGKSDSLRHLAEYEAKSPKGSMLRVGRGSDIPMNWASSCIDDWRGNSRFPTKDLRESLERLRIANPEVGPPLLTLALDGIDENVKELHEDYIRSLIRELVKIDRASRTLAGKPPDVRLFVTCREERELSKYLETDISGFQPEAEKDYRRVDFGPFTPEEFWTVVITQEPNLVDSIFQSSNMFAGLSAHPLDLVTGIGATPQVYGNLEFLRDPFIWRAFTLLCDTDRDELLERKPLGELKLGVKLLERFRDKTTDRCNWEHPEMVVETLKFIAAEFQQTNRPRNRAHWLEEAHKFGAFGPIECRRLFDEALNGGLIVGGPVSWDWRHQFIKRALGV